MPGQTITHRTLRIGLAQLNTTVGDLQGNLQKIQRTITEAKAQGCELLAFPELFLTGYPPEDLLLKPQFIRDSLAALKLIATHTAHLTVIVGCLDRDAHGHLYNAAAVFTNTTLRGAYHKMCLPNYGVFDERRYFTPGKRPVVLAWRGTRIGLNICEDIWQPDGPLMAQARAGATLILNISASPYHAGKLHERRALIKDWAQRARVHLAYVNLIGGQDELVFDGGSLIMNDRGELLAQAPLFEEDVLVADVPLPSRPRRAAASSRARVRTLAISVSRPMTPQPVLAARRVVPLDPLEEIYRALVLGTRDYVRKNGFETVVLGLSGGIDSALVAAIAADALGRDHVVALAMSSRYSSAETQADAVRLAERLGLRFWRVPIDAVLESYLTQLAPVVPHRPADVTEQNLQARIRGTILMACSNTFGWLVLSTGNKSEIATGYCTLYGDMAGGFAILKDVPKTLVYQLARHRNHRAATSLIPESIFTRPPTAELAPNQTDQDVLPPYDVLDPILKGYIEAELSRRDIVRRHVDDETVRRVIAMVDRSEYKRRQGAPGIKITPRAFGKDRRMPITNRYQEGLIGSAFGVRRSAGPNPEPRTPNERSARQAH